MNKFEHMCVGMVGRSGPKILTPPPLPVSGLTKCGVILYAAFYNSEFRKEKQKAS